MGEPAGHDFGNLSTSVRRAGRHEERHANVVTGNIRTYSTGVISEIVTGHFS